MRHASSLVAACGLVLLPALTPFPASSAAEPYHLVAPSPTPIPAPAVLNEAPEYAAYLVKKHRDFVGWSADDASASTFRESGTITDADKKTTPISLVRSGPIFRKTFVDKYGLTVANGFDGHRFWSSDENGFTVYPAGAITSGYILDALLFSEMNDHATPKVVNAHVKVDDTFTDVLRLTTSGGATMDVYVVPETGAYKRVVLDPSGEFEATFNGIEYKEVDGKRYIAGWHFGESKVHYAFTEVKPAVAIPTADLQPPLQTAHWSYATTTVPINTGKPVEQIIIDVAFNGVHGKFLLDSGAAGIAVFDSFARSAGATKFGSAGIGGFGGSASANLFRIRDVSIGDATLHDVIVYSGLDEKEFRSTNAVGLIGYDLFAQMTADLDFDKKTLTLRQPTDEPEPVPPDALAFPLDLSDGLMHIPMVVNGKIDVLGVLDTGAYGGITIAPGLLRRGLASFDAHPQVFGGVGGADLELCGKLDTLQLGPISYKPVPACMSFSESGNEINVGIDFLQNFNYTFDYPHARLIIRHRAASTH